MSENESQVAAAPQAAAAVSEGAAPAEKPAQPTRRTRRTKAAEAEEAAADQAPEAAASVRRTRRKKAEQEAATEPTAAEPQDKPAQPTRRTRRTKAAEEGEGASPDAKAAASESEQPADQAEKPVRKRRSTKAAASGEGPEAVAAKDQEPASQEKPAKAASSSKDEKPREGKDDAAEKPAASEEGKSEAKAEKQSAKTERGKAREDQGQARKQRDRKQRDREAQAGSGKQQRDRDRDRRRQRRQRDSRNREVAPSITREELAALKVAELRAKAAELELDVKGLKKAELVEAVFAASAKAEGFIDVEGVLDILADGYGFLRTQGYLPSEGDVYVGANLIRRNGLRKGDLISGKTRPARENEKYAAIHKIERVNGKDPESLGKRIRFADLTPIYPDERLWMEHGKNTITARVIDLTAPIGKGQRGLIVSPPKAGKTTILKDIAAAITANNPEVHLICLLVDERPEEVTDMERSIRGEVISSTFDMPCENHIAVAELVIERAKRLVEEGRDVVVLLDSLTRLARAYNLAQPASGRILSGGVDSTALYPPKKFLGAARNIENGGSLTILASALVETGSKMDEVIFEEFKGTGNMELKLDRALADRRIFPAIDPIASGTRKEDLLLQPQEAPLIWAVRRILSNMNSTERSMDTLIKSLKQTDTNAEFLVRTARKAHGGKSEADMSL